VKLEVPLHRTRTFGVLKSWFAVAGGAGGKWRGFGTSRCRHPEKAVLQEEQADLSPISNTGTSPWFTIVIWPPTMRMRPPRPGHGAREQQPIVEDVPSRDSPGAGTRRGFRSLCPHGHSSTCAGAGREH
jgi:hypothetical protein